MSNRYVSFKKLGKTAWSKNIFLLIAGLAFFVISARIDFVKAKSTEFRPAKEISTWHVVNFSDGLDSVPDALKRVKNVHPRLYMTKKSLVELRAKMTSEPYIALLEKLKAIANKAVNSGPPAYRAGRPNDEQLWQREVGNAIPELAMAYCMTGNPKYLKGARDYMLASASYPTWGAGNLDNTDLATGHQLYGLALGYDWLYSDLDVTSRDSIRDCLVKRGKCLYELLANEKVWWHRYYLQNHQHVNLAGLAAAGFALHGEAHTDQWILLPLKKFRQVIATSPPDGGWHEGIPYTGYSLEYILKFLDLSASLLGEDFFQRSSYLKNVASFRLYGSIPADYWLDSKSTIMTFGDCPRMDYYGPDYLLRKLASEYKDGYAQWLADKMDSCEVTKPEAFFLNLLWMDAGIKPLPPVALKTFRHFKDLDIVYMRSRWDGKESLSMFKCGPPLGHYATSWYKYDPCAGHTHPDVGAFQIFSHGDWLISDDGYAYKRTQYQNTLVVNGKGQIGEGTWFNGKLYLGTHEHPKIVYAKSNKDYDYVIGNAKPAYLPDSHLTFFNRHLLYLKPDCWVLADEVRADTASLFEFYCHSDYPFVSENSNIFKAGGSRGSIKVTLLKPENVDKQAILQDIQGTGGRFQKQMNVLKLSSANKSTDFFLTVFEAYPNGGAPTIEASVVSSRKGEILLLKSTNGTRSFRILTDRKDKNTPLFVEK